MTALHITARGLEKSYPQPGALRGAKKVLRGLSFQFAEGERIGVIGRNGAGKTTLLQLIAGIGVPTGGVLEINGHVTAIFTLGLGLREDLSGRENIFIDGELQGRSHAETAAVMAATIAFAELGEFIDRPVRTYSTGMKARLAFSMLVHIEPEILIIDEALSVGDAQFARKATAKMRELTQRGKILIVVSHSMGAIRDMCNRCLWIDGGVIRMDGTPEALSDHPSLVSRVERAQERAAALPADAHTWRRAPIANAQRYAALRQRTQLVAKTMPTSEQVALAQTLLSAVPSCVLPVDPPAQKEAQRRIAVAVREASAQSGPQP